MIINIFYNMKPIYIVVIIIVVVLILYSTSEETIAVNPRPVEIFWFHRPDCSYCVKMKPEWEKAERQLKEKNITVRRVNINKPQHADIVAKFKISSVPQIVKIKPGGVRVDYKGNRSSPEMVAWVLKD